MARITKLTKIIKDLENSTVRIKFTDGDSRILRIISISHLNLDKTIIADDLSKKPLMSIQFNIEDIKEIETLDHNIIFQ